MLDFSVTFLITIANLAILVLVLKKLLWKPVTDFMDARSRKVREELEGAAASRARAEELEARYESLLANAEAEGEWVVKDAEDRAREEYRRIVAAAEADAAAIRLRAEERAGLELGRARDELAAEVAALAVAAAARIAGRGLGGADDAADAEAYIRSAEAGRGR